MSKKLFFADFVKKLLFAYLEQVSSLRSLTLELKTNQKCRELGLADSPFSTLKDGFYRFSTKSAKTLFETVLSEMNFKRIKHLDEVGLFASDQWEFVSDLGSDELESVSKAEKCFQIAFKF